MTTILLDNLSTLIEVLPSMINRHFKDNTIPLYREKIINNIFKLPLKEYTGAGNENCCICTEPLRPGCLVGDLSCGHTIHAHCLYSLIFGGDNKCPVCRANIIQDFDDTEDMILYREDVNIILAKELVKRIKTSISERGSLYEELKIIE